MFKFLFKLLVITSSLMAPLSSYAEEATSNQTQETTSSESLQESQLPTELEDLNDLDVSVEPKIITRFFSAEMCQAISKLKTLNTKNPGFHKILMKVEGFPKHQEIIVEMKRPLGKTPDQFKQIVSFEIQDDGTYLTSEKESLNYILGTSRGFLPGERVAVRIRTADGSVSREITGTPNPIIRKDSKGAIAVRAELLSLNPAVYLIELPTMKEGEEFELTSSALGETTKSKIKYSAANPLHYSPVLKDNNTGGHSTLKIKRKDGDVYQIRMPWGAALDPYIQGGKCYPYEH